MDAVDLLHSICLCFLAPLHGQRRGLLPHPRWQAGAARFWFGFYCRRPLEPFDFGDLWGTVESSILRLIGHTVLSAEPAHDALDLSLRDVLNAARVAWERRGVGLC